MTTLAKTKAQALVQPAKPLAVTPNVRLFNSPAAGATLSLSTESTNIVQVVNPASTLSIKVDSQNFSAFGANHFVLQVDTTAATEISLNFVRGATILTTKVIEIDADQIAVLTFAAITKANDAVSLLAIGHHVVGKSEATDGNGAVGGLPLIPTGAIKSVDGEYQRFVYDGSSTIEVFVNVLWPAWHAGLAESSRQHEYQITLKVPVVGDNQSSQLLIADAEAANIFNVTPLNRLKFAVQESSNYTSLSLGLAGDDNPSTTVVFEPAPASGSTVTLTLTTNSIDYAWDQGTGSLPIPAGFFTTAPNVLAYSVSDNPAAIVPLSIKVAGA